MNLYRLLQQRVAVGNPVRVGLIGAGKFGSMYLSQIPRTPGIHLLGIADLNPARAAESLRRVGWKEGQFAAQNFKQAYVSGNTHITDDTHALIRNRHIEVIIDATGSPAAGIAHVLACCEQKKAHRNGERRGRCTGRAACWQRVLRKPASFIRWPTVTSRR